MLLELCVESPFCNLFGVKWSNKVVCTQDFNVEEFLYIQFLQFVELKSSEFFFVYTICVKVFTLAIQRL